MIVQLKEMCRVVSGEGRASVLLLSALVSVVFTQGEFVQADELIPGRFLAVCKTSARSLEQRVCRDSEIQAWSSRLKIQAVPVKGSRRLYELTKALGYSERDLLKSGLWTEVTPDAWIEAGLDVSNPPSALPEGATAGFVEWVSGRIFSGLTSATQKFPSEWQIKPNWALERIQAPRAWSHRTSTDDIVIAVLDSGVDIQHPDLRENLWKNPGEIPGNGIDDDQNGWIDDIHGYDSHYETVEVQDQVGHGTALAGIIGAQGDNAAANGLESVGVAWKTRLMVIRGDDHRRMSWTGAVKGAYYARDNGARVVNASWGTYSATTGLREMVRDLEASGVMLVNAVGNNSNNVDTQHRAYPSGYATSNLIVVTALHPNEKLVHYADFGEKYVHLAAPGWAIPTTLLGGKAGVQAGCSVAAPFVTAAVALVWAEHPEWTHHQVREQILSTVDIIPSLRGKVATSGVLNLARALGLD